MYIEINNYRGIANARIEIADTLTVVGADHGEGKSSIAQAVGTVFTGSALPFAGVTKADAKLLLHKGAEAGSVRLVDGDNGATVEWPSCKYSTIQDAPLISEVAAGLASVMSMKAADRLDYIAELMGARPSRDDLAAECVKAKLDPTGTWFTNLWETIELNGWNVAEKHHRERGAELKGVWQDTTGDKYGKTKANGWMPADWAADLDDANEDTLVAEFEAATKALEAALKTTAISESDRDTLQAKAQTIPILKAEHEKAQAAVKLLSKEVAELERTRRTLPSASVKTTACPHCGKPVHINGKELEKSDAIDEKVIEQRLEDIRQCDKTIATQRAEESKAIANEATVGARLTEARGALATLTAATDVVSADDVELENARGLANRTNSRLSAFQARHKADSLASKILKNQELIDILSPKGLRQTKLDDALGRINAALADLCTAAGWSATVLRTDGVVTFAGIPYALLAESEQYRVDRLLQLLVAQAQNARCIVVDRADTLLKATRNGLVKCLLRMQIPALLFVALDSKDMLPNLSKLNGRAYWVENATVTEG